MKEGCHTRIINVIWPKIDVMII